MQRLLHLDFAFRQIYIYLSGALHHQVETSTRSIIQELRRVSELVAMDLDDIETVCLNLESDRLHTRQASNRQKGHEPMQVASCPLHAFFYRFRKAHVWGAWTWENSSWSHRPCIDASHKKRIGGVLRRWRRRKIGGAATGFSSDGWRGNQRPWAENGEAKKITLIGTWFMPPIGLYKKEMHFI